jgi:hypothetical protein
MIVEYAPAGLPRLEAALGIAEGAMMMLVRSSTLTPASGPLIVDVDIP